MGGAVEVWKKGYPCAPTGWGTRRGDDDDEVRVGREGGAL